MKINTCGLTYWEVCNQFSTKESHLKDTHEQKKKINETSDICVHSQPVFVLFLPTTEPDSDLITKFQLSLI